MIKSNQFSYEIPEGTRKGAFNIYQGRDGAIYLLMGTVYTALTLQQVNDLHITPDCVKDYDHDKFGYYYNIESVPRACMVIKDGEYANFVHNIPNLKVKLLDYDAHPDDTLTDAHIIFSKNVYEHFTDHSDPVEQETYHELKNQKF